MKEKALVPEARPRSYYGQPVIKPPVWTWEVPAYFFAGGLAGTSAGLAYLAGLRGNRVLARRAWALALAGVAVSPPLLISDLGRPERFLNMLRVFKVTSPMSVGSWLLNAEGALITAAALGVRPGFTRPGAALLGLPLATYTGALVANTAVPVWHEARAALPFLFAAGAAASAAAAAVAVTPARHAAPARRLAVLGAGAELAAGHAMERRLGDVGSPYREGGAGTLNRAADALTLAGGLVVGSRRAARIGAGLLLAGAAAKRWAVFRAGLQSAADPAQTVGPQRRRIREGHARGAERAAA